MADDPEFKALGPDTKLCIYTAKLILGPSGIDVVRCFTMQMQDLTGLEEERLVPALNEALAGNWIAVQGDVVWLRNGLKFNPNFTLGNPKHRTAIERHVSGLPKCEIVNAYAVYYGLPVPHSGIPTEWVSIPYAIQVVGSRYKVEGSEAKASGGEPPLFEPSSRVTPHAETMGVLRECGFACDKHDGSIVKALLRKGHQPEAIQNVARGLAVMRKTGELRGIPPGQKLSMKLVYADKDDQTLALWVRAKVAFEQERKNFKPANLAVL